MGIPFFVVFVLSIAFLSLGITAWGDFVSVAWDKQVVFLFGLYPFSRGGDFISVAWDKQGSSHAASDTIAVTRYLSFQSDYWAMTRCFTGFLLFLVSLYFMGFFLYLEERESGRIMKNVKSFAKLRRFLERHQKGGGFSGG